MSVSTHSRAEAAAQQQAERDAKNAVSTHSRAEAAALVYHEDNLIYHSFNTQPRGGGCSLHKKARKISELNTVFR